MAEDALLIACSSRALLPGGGASSCQTTRAAAKECPYAPRRDTHARPEEVDLGWPTTFLNCWRASSRRNAYLRRHCHRVVCARKRYDALKRIAPRLTRIGRLPRHVQMRAQRFARRQSKLWKQLACVFATLCGFGKTDGSYERIKPRSLNVSCIETLVAISGPGTASLEKGKGPRVRKKRNRKSERRTRKDESVRTEAPKEGQSRCLVRKNIGFRTKQLFPFSPCFFDHGDSTRGPGVAMANANAVHAVRPKFGTLIPMAISDVPGRASSPSPGLGRAFKPDPGPTRAGLRSLSNLPLPIMLPVAVKRRNTYFDYNRRASECRPGPEPKPDPTRARPPGQVGPRILSSPSPLRPDPSPGFQARPDPNNTNGHERTRERKMLREQVFVEDRFWGVECRESGAQQRRSLGLGRITGPEKRWGKILEKDRSLKYGSHAGSESNRLRGPDAGCVWIPGGFSSTRARQAECVRVIAPALSGVKAGSSEPSSSMLLPETVLERVLRRRRALGTDAPRERHFKHRRAHCAAICDVGGERRSVARNRWPVYDDSGGPRLTRHTMRAAATECSYALRRNAHARREGLDLGSRKHSCLPGVSPLPMPSRSHTTRALKRIVLKAHPNRPTAKSHAQLLRTELVRAVDAITDRRSETGVRRGTTSIRASTRGGEGHVVRMHAGIVLVSFGPPYSTIYGSTTAGMEAGGEGDDGRSAPSHIETPWRNVVTPPLLTLACGSTSSSRSLRSSTALAMANTGAGNLGSGGTGTRSITPASFAPLRLWSSRESRDSIACSPRLYDSQ
ncbi:hypothetical protein B0H11DRAFT_1908769 [Mycena galericulata]|nr:hypothetical protein B0H11DRAFT_1908769 [Mycena galericulata]